MLQIKIENFKPVSEIPSTEWRIEYEEGQWFRATCDSRDGNITCVYTLDDNFETVENKKRNHYVQSGFVYLNNKKKPITSDNGTGIVRLSGGYVSKRFGYFRKNNFQEFLDEFSITGIRNFTEFGFNTTFLIENNDEKTSRLLVPKNCRVSMVRNGKCMVWNGHSSRLDDQKMKEVSNPSRNAPDILIAHVKNAQFFIYEEKTTGDDMFTPPRTQRKLYIHGSANNVMGFRDDLKEIMNQENCISV